MVMPILVAEIIPGIGKMIIKGVRNSKKWFGNANYSK